MSEETGSLDGCTWTTKAPQATPAHIIIADKSIWAFSGFPVL